MTLKLLHRWRPKVLRSDRNDHAGHEANKHRLGLHQRTQWFATTLPRLGETIRPWLPPINFITVHWAYFILISLIASVIFWGSANHSQSMDYWDSLFLTVSALTSAGLNSVNLSGEPRPLDSMYLLILGDCFH